MQNDSTQGIPREAREGLERAWLAILAERYPQFTWAIVDDPSEDDPDRRTLEGRGPR
jgi:hypothetical protein